MKKTLLSFILIALMASSGFAQNLVTNGGFELPDDGKKHLYITERTGWYSDDAKENNNGTEYQTGWEGKYYQYCVNTAGTIYQPIDKIITDSVTYHISYLYSIGWNDDAGKDTVYSVVYLSHYTPGNIKGRKLIDSVATDVTSLLYNRQLVTVSYKLPANLAYAGDSLVIEFATRVENKDKVSNNTWTNMDSIVVIKLEGIYSDQPFWKEFNAATKVDATNIRDNSDFSVKGKIAWDSKYIYLNLEVTDDSIYAEGNNETWNLDNFEIYFDMNNGKIPLYPRGAASWPSSQDGKPGYWQIRLIPGRTFEEVNPGFKGGNQNYQITETGYKYELTICMDSLLKGFVPVVGKEIGFDILASDNDNDPFYRDQLSIHSPLATIWCDAAMWGTIKFTNNGGFNFVYDQIKPTKVTNLLATQGKNKVLLTWDAATDNIVVEKYVISINNIVDTAIYAKLTENAYIVNDIKPEVKYTFSIVAEDIEGNQSDQASTSFTYVGVNDAEPNKLSIYPNPSSSFISLKNETRVNLEVYNVAGQLLILKLVNAGEKVDISSLSNGIYYLRIIECNNASVLKLVKK